MMKQLFVGVTGMWLCSGCGPAVEGSSAMGSGTSSGGAMANTEAEADAETSEMATDISTGSSEPEMISASDFEACGAEVGDECVIGFDHCICGPRCGEYGPAGAPGRCPRGEFFTLCTWTYVCVIPCSEDADCPDPEMVCRACPEEIEYACMQLGGYALPELNGGPMMCSYAE